MKKQVGVIGLGKFGLKFGRVLVSLGHQVLGIDNDPGRVQEAHQGLTQVVQADAMNREALEQLRVKDLEHVLVSVGDSIAASVMISMHIKEMGGPKVWVKAIHPDHEKVLYKIGVDEVIIPEYMAANRIANSIAMPGFIAYLPFDRSMAVKEFEIDDWSGKSLRELDITNRYGMQVIAYHSTDDDTYRYIPKADDVLVRGDSLVVIGEITQLADLKT